MRKAVQRAAVVVLTLLAVGGGAVLTGRNGIVITHGVSMNPVYYQGDLVVVQRQKAYAAGDIVAYRRPDIHLVVLHRIIGGDASGWVFKGDNNQSVDPTKPTESQLIGRAVLHVPQGGIWLHRLTAPPVLAACAFLLLLGGSRTRRDIRKERRTMSPRHRARPSPTLSALPPSLHPIAAGAAVLGLAGAALSGLAWTHATQQLVPAATSATSQMRFAYSARVPRSAAYDSTTVRAPQPVFRKLTNTVDVAYSYTGRPGALTVTVELSSAQGWHSTIPVGVARIGRQYQGHVGLDLRALQRRADAAAAATGLPGGPLTVAVVPAVAASGGGAFTPRFEMGLDELVLKPTSDLTVSDRARTRGTRAAPAQLRALGHGLSVSRGRSLGLVALLLALIAGGVLAAVARMTGPVAEAERIRARYRDLLLPVLPIALQPGRPVVDLPGVDALARLAERYGLLVLHWSRGGVDTYVVQDEATTYRYRTGTSARETVDA